MERFLWVCLGGALGSGARYLVGLWAEHRFGSAFPWGTLLINGAGCFFIGLVMELASIRSGFPPLLRLALTAGFLGGFTTYSAFAYEASSLVRAGSAGLGFLYVALTTGLSLFAVTLGVVAARVAP